MSGDPWWIEVGLQAIDDSTPCGTAIAKTLPSRVQAVPHP